MVVFKKMSERGGKVQVEECIVVSVSEKVADIRKVEKVDFF